MQTNFIYYCKYGVTAKGRHCEFQAKNFYIKGQMTMGKCGIHKRVIQYLPFAVITPPYEGFP